MAIKASTTYAHQLRKIQESYSRSVGHWQKFTDTGDFYFRDPATDTYTYAYACGHKIQIKGSELAAGRKVNPKCQECAALGGQVMNYMTGITQGQAVQLGTTIQIQGQNIQGHRAWLDNEITRVRRKAFA